MSAWWNNLSELVVVRICVPRGSPSCLLSLQEALRGSQVDLTQDPLKLLSLPGSLKLVRICMCPVRTEFLVPTVPWFFVHKPFIFLVQDLWSLMCGLNLSLPGENFCNCDDPSLCGSLPWGCGSRLYCASIPPTYLIIVPSLYLWKKVKVLVTQSCPTLSLDSMDYGLPGSSVPGILQERILGWVAISFSRGSSWPRDWTQISCIAD